MLTQGIKLMNVFLRKLTFYLENNLINNVVMKLIQSFAPGQINIEF